MDAGLRSSISNCRCEHTRDRISILPWVPRQSPLLMMGTHSEERLWEYLIRVWSGSIMYRKVASAMIQAPDKVHSERK
jgi:hypothetical protein